MLTFFRLVLSFASLQKCYVLIKIGVGQDGLALG
jgi:hypothetical protein